MKIENYLFFRGFKTGVSKFRFKTDIHTLSANLKFYIPKNCHFWFTLKGPVGLEISFTISWWNFQKTTQLNTKSPMYLVSSSPQSCLPGEILKMSTVWLYSNYNGSCRKCPLSSNSHLFVWSQSKSLTNAQNFQVFSAK